MKKRIFYMDVLRVLACLAVIFNHSGGYFLFGERTPGGLLYQMELALSISCKMAVPVFFAISGALILNRETGIRKLYAGRIARIALALTVFSIISYLVSAAQGRTAVDLRAMFFGMYDAELNFSYWYLYAYLAFLVISPLLGSMMRGFGNWEILYMLALGLLFKAVLPMFEMLRWNGAHRLNPQFDLSFVTGDIVLYPALGYFIHHRMSVQAVRKAAPAALLAATAAVLICMEATLAEYYRTWIPKVEPVTAAAKPFLCIAVMMTARAWLGDGEAKGRAGTAVTALAGLSFGIYLLHIPVLHSKAMVRIFSAFCEALPLPRMMEYAVQVIAVAVICGAVTALLRRIPGMRHLLS